MELAQEKEEEARRLRERYMQRMEEQTSRENIVLSRVYIYTGTILSCMLAGNSKYYTLH